MTNTEYVAKHGLNCPACGGTAMEGYEIEIDAGTATQEVSCLDCGASWIDVYKLQGFLGLTDANDKFI